MAGPLPVTRLKSSPRDMSLVGGASWVWVWLGVRVGVEVLGRAGSPGCGEPPPPPEIGSWLALALLLLSEMGVV